MVSRPSGNLLIALCLSLSALLFFLGTGLSPLWPLTWLAPIPVLWIAPRVSAGEAFFVAVAAYALGELNDWRYSRTVLPTWLVASILLLVACVFGLAVLFFRSRILRGKLWQAALIVPAFWVAVAYLIAITSVHGTFGDISYSQMDFLPILQIASVTGIWGISFCIFLFAATMAALLSVGSRTGKSSVSHRLFLCSSRAYSGLEYGVWRQRREDSPTVKVALIASDEAGNLHPATLGQEQVVYGRYAEQMKALAAQGVQVFVSA